MAELLPLAREIVAGLLLAAGSVFVVTGSIGLVRLPYFFARLHAASVTDTMGAALVLAGMAVIAGFQMATIKLALILLFLVFTSPTATHALAKAALHGGLRARTGQDNAEGEDK